MDAFHLAYCICVDPYLYVEDEFDRQERWMDAHDDALAGNEDEEDE